MKTIIDGYRYELENFENKNEVGQVISFINKEPVLAVMEPGMPPVPTGELKLVHDGTTNEEVIKMLLNRMNFLQSKFPCRENAIAITKLDEALLWLEKRTADRVNRNVEGKHLK